MVKRASQKPEIVKTVLKKNKRDPKPVKNAKEGSEPTESSKKNFSKPSVSRKPTNSKLEKDGKPTEPPNWIEYKKQKKELRIKRKEGKYEGDHVHKVKALGENLRRKVLKGGTEERSKLVNKMHKLLSGNYSKCVMMHDLARIIQYILKFGSPAVRTDIIKELLPVTLDMMQSKYAKYCVRRMFKYSPPETRSEIFKKLTGKAVKLASHAVSAPILEHVYTNYATPTEKIRFIQEFFGDIYKSSKDDTIKHLRDVYKNDPAMKTAALSATKANLNRILNKDLLDSALVQSVLSQFLVECKEDDKSEVISQLSPHVVVLSNSKDGARAAMQCIWHGTNKDRKAAMKALKEHVIDLAKHEHAHTTIISLLDCVDDTVLVQKILVKRILQVATDLASDEWGRKVLLWLVAPGDTLYFHPTFLNELTVGREHSSSKKASDVRRSEILTSSSDVLLDLIASDAKFWMSNASIGMLTLAVLKSGKGMHLENALRAIAALIVDPKWAVKHNDSEISGVEHPGMHMVLKKLALNDKLAKEDSKITLGECVVELLTNKTIKSWLKMNRGCFLLTMLFENGGKSTRKKLVHLLEPHLDFLKDQDSKGAKILLQNVTK